MSLTCTCHLNARNATLAHWYLRLLFFSSVFRYRIHYHMGICMESCDSHAGLMRARVHHEGGRAEIRSICAFETRYRAALKYFGLRKLWLLYIHFYEEVIECVFAGIVRM